MLEVDHLTIGYRAPEHVVAHDISVSLVPGELVCLIGPNGAGKSTLMRTLAGMQPALAGEVRLDGSDVQAMPARERARQLGVVLTERITAGLLTAYSLVSLGRYPHTNWMGRMSDRDHEVVRWALDTVGAAELARRHVGDLSDGERQKVMIARALAQEPRLMILDEVTAFLDLPRRVEVMRLLRHMARSTGRAILLSTHDLDLALRSADRIWLLPAGGPLATGAPEDLVLGGAFEAAFASEGIEFDREHGAFQIHRKFDAEVELAGRGVELFWTRRALEREGLHIRENGRTAALRVEVLTVQGRPCWRLTGDGETRRYDTLYELTRFLRNKTQGGTLGCDVQPAPGLKSGNPRGVRHQSPG